MPNFIENRGASYARPELIGMSFRQSIPWRVALQHSAPPLPLPTSFCTSGPRSPGKVSRKGAVHSSRVNEHVGNQKLQAVRKRATVPKASKHADFLFYNRHILKAL